MLKKILLAYAAVSVIFLFSCGKKTIPNRTATVTPGNENTNTVTPKKAPTPPTVVVTKTDTATAKAVPDKPIPKPESKPEFPKVITVNDNAASKSVDGRLFYDVLGHRYWKNYSDGKYYLFDKSMYSNPDFKPPK